MKITRVINGINIDIELTPEEMQEAHMQVIVDFMKSELMTNFAYEEEIATKIAKDAYSKYSTCDGLTEYECIEQAVDEYDEHELYENIS